MTQFKLHHCLFKYGRSLSQFPLSVNNICYLGSQSGDQRNKKLHKPVLLNHICVSLTCIFNEERGNEELHLKMNETSSLKRHMKRHLFLMMVAADRSWISWQAFLYAAETCDGICFMFSSLVVRYQWYAMSPLLLFHIHLMAIWFFCYLCLN